MFRWFLLFACCLLMVTPLPFADADENEVPSETPEHIVELRANFKPKLAHGHPFCAPLLALWSKEQQLPSLDNDPQPPIVLGEDTSLIVLRKRLPKTLIIEVGGRVQAKKYPGNAFFGNHFHQSGYYLHTKRLNDIVNDIVNGWLVYVLSDLEPLVDEPFYQQKCWALLRHSRIEAIDEAEVEHTHGIKKIVVEQPFADQQAFSLAEHLQVLPTDENTTIQEHVYEKNDNGFFAIHSLVNNVYVGFITTPVLIALSDIISIK